MERKATLNPGDKVKFNLMGLDSEFIALDYEDIIPCNNKVATVVCLATYTELGERDFEYYDIKFEDGKVFEAISGYHLMDLHY